jgi:hypothetical protein
VISREPGSDDAPKYPFNPIPMGEFLDKVIPPPEWLVPNLLQARTLTLLLAAPNAGKTFLALDMATQTAAQNKRVLIMEQEGTEGGFQTRLRRSAVAANLSREQKNLIEVDWNSGLSLLNSLHVEYLIEWIRMKDIRLLILDSLAALAHGMDENSNTEMAAIAESLYRIKTSTEVTVLGLHHTVKSDWRPGKTPTLASGRGHGALYGRIDDALGLVAVDAPAGLVRFELHVLKMREGGKEPPRLVEVLMTGEAATMTSEPLPGRTVSRPVGPRLRSIPMPTDDDAPPPPLRFRLTDPDD